MRDLRVLEVAADVDVAYCGRLLASAGADVVLAEPPGGGPLRHAAPMIVDRDGRRRSATHEYLHAGKRSVVLTPLDPDFDAAVRWADVVLGGCDGDVAAARVTARRIAAANRRAVHTVVSGFGLTGPYAGWRHSSLIDWAAGGYLYLTGEADREPVQGGGPWASYITGTTAAIATAAAVMEATRTGRGELVDVGAMEAVAAAHQWTIVTYTHTGAVKRRWGTRFGEAHYPLSLYQCVDGRWFCVVASTRDQWTHFCETTGTLDLLADPALHVPGIRFERADEIDARVAPFLATHTAAEAVELLQANRVPAGPMLDFVDVLASPHVRDRGFWQRRDDLAPGAVMPGAPFALGAGISGVAPALGAHDEAFRRDRDGARARTLPSIDLSQVRLLELTVAWAGPLAGRWLADLGVDVVKVEHPTARGGRVDMAPPTPGEWRWGELAPARVRAPVYPDGDPGVRPWNRGGSFNKLNRGRRGLCLDAKAPGGREVLDALIAGADVLVHNFTPRGRARWASIRNAWPCTTAGWRPWRCRAGARRVRSRGTRRTARSSRPTPGSTRRPAIAARVRCASASPSPTPSAGCTGRSRCSPRSGSARSSALSVHVDVAQLETMLAIAGEGILTASITGVAPARIGNRSPDHAPQGVYPCTGDDAWVALTVRSDDEWRALVDIVDDGRLRAIADADVAARRVHHDTIDDALAGWSASRSAAAAADVLQRAGIAASPVLTNKDLVEDRHLAARGFIVEWDQPDVGPMRFPGFPVHFERRPVALRPAPSLGQHNDEILRALGFDDDARAALVAAGTIADAPPRPLPL